MMISYQELVRTFPNLFVRSGISFVDRSEVLTHIGNEMLAKGVVYDTWPQALIAREAEFPTGIMLEQHAIAIPHCEAIHAKSSAIYLLRPTNKVHFQQADDDNDVEVSGNDSNLLIVFYVQIMPDDFVMQLHRF